MNTRYLLNDLKLSEEDHQYLLKKISKLEKFLKNCKDHTSIRLEIEVNQDKRSFWVVEIMLKMPKKLFRVEKVGKTFIMAVDEAEDALMKQLRRFKDKMITLRRRQK